jgi:DMSO/TMAO reductase YedYZ molybdopterin-dependent catalytic subunit
MRKLTINLLLALFTIGFLTVYCAKPKNQIQNTEGKGITSFKNGVMPNGGRLLPAEEGPVRSALGVPAINLSTFKLEITGLVDSSFHLTWNEIIELPETNSDTMIMYCVEGWEVWGKWEGIQVEDLLNKAHVKPEGKYVVFSSADGYTTCLPISYLEKYKAMLAYNVNGSPLKANDGFPLRLVAFGKFGYKWAKWVNSLKVVDKPQNGFWESEGFSDQAEVEISRRIYYEGRNANPLDY